MKALAVRQPWAWLIVHGYKKNEYRSWPTSYRGLVFIHASKKLADNSPGIVRECLDAGIPLPDYVDGGGIVGIVEIVDCLPADGGGYRFLPTDGEGYRFLPADGGGYRFLLANARPLPFKSFRGRLGFFETNFELEDFQK